MNCKLCNLKLHWCSSYKLNQENEFHLRLELCYNCYNKIGGNKIYDYLESEIESLIIQAELDLKKLIQDNLK